MKRTVDIAAYWPWVLGNTGEFQALAAGESPELAGAWNSAEVVQRNQYLSDSDDYGVTRWENMLKVVPRAGESLDDRKRRISWIMNTRLPYTIRMLRWYLKTVDPDARPDLDHDQYLLRVLFSNLDMDQIVEQSVFLREVIPANLVLEAVRFQAVAKTVYPAALASTHTTHTAPVPQAKPSRIPIKARASAVCHTYYHHKAGGPTNYA